MNSQGTTCSLFAIYDSCDIGIAVSYRSLFFLSSVPSYYCSPLNQTVSGKTGRREKTDDEEGEVRAGSSKPPWGRSQTGAGSFYLSSQDQAGARTKEWGRADRKGEIRAVGDSIISHCLFRAVPLYVNVKSEPGPERFHDKLVVYVPVGQMI